MNALESKCRYIQYAHLAVLITYLVGPANDHNLFFVDWYGDGIHAALNMIIASDRDPDNFLSSKIRGNIQRLYATPGLPGENPSTKDEECPPMYTATM